MSTPSSVARAGLLLAACLAASPAARAQPAKTISLTALDVPYRQDFDTLAAIGASDVLPAGWAIAESGDHANITYTAGTGSGTAGDTYSFGASASPERALGMLPSRTVDPMLGALFTNDTGTTITSLEIAYTGEQWRLGSLKRFDPLRFQYSRSTESLTAGRWEGADMLDFMPPVTGPTVGALDGNAPAHRAARKAIVTGLSIPPGVTFGIRWANFFAAIDFSATHGLAVDEFSLTPRSSGTASGYYQGRLRVSGRDPIPVGVSLCVEGDTIRGSYFYLRVGTDIALRGTRKPDEAFELEETTPAGAVSGRWSGRLGPTITGTWTSPKGDSHPFSLEKVGAVPADSPAAGQGRVAAQPCSDVGYRMARVSPKKQDYFPRLVRFRNRTIMASVNVGLAFRARTWFEELDDDARHGCEMGRERTAHVGVEYASRDVLSIRVIGDVDCFGPGGVNSRRDDSLTYDLRSGDPVTDVTGLFKPGTPWKELFGVLFAYQIAEAAGPDGECLRQYSPENLAPDAVAFHLTAEGLLVGPWKYGLISRVHHCEQLTVVPFAALRGLADPNGVLARVAAASPAPPGPARYRIRDWMSDEGVEIVYEPPSLQGR